MKSIIVLFTLISLLSSCSNQTTQEKTGSESPEIKEIPKITSELMPEDQFWAIIATTKNTNRGELAKRLENAIFQLSNAEMIGFYLRQQKLSYDSYNSDLWCAAYIMNGGCSDDCFDYFRCWLIMQGKDVFYASIENPDTLVSMYKPDYEFYEFEDLMYITFQPFEKKTGQDLYDYVDKNALKFGDSKYINFEFSWEESDEESMKSICPKLMAKAWN